MVTFGKYFQTKRGLNCIVRETLQRLLKRCSLASSLMDLPALNIHDVILRKCDCEGGTLVDY